MTARYVPAGDTVGKVVGRDRAKQAQDVECVLVDTSVGCLHTFGDLVDLGDQQGSGAGHSNADGASVVGVERVKFADRVVDERALEALGTSCGTLAVTGQACTSPAWSGDGFGDQQVELDIVGGAPLAGIGLEFEVVGFQQLGECRRVGQQFRGDRQVGVGRGLGDGQVRRTGVFVDRLCADHDQRTKVWAKGLEAVEQHPARQDTHWARRFVPLPRRARCRPATTSRAFASDVTRRYERTRTW